MHRLLVPLVLVAAGAGLLAEPPKGASTPEQLVAQLGDPDFATRERAVAALRSLGPAALPAIQRATTSTNPEIRQRAAALVPVLKAQAALEPRQITLKHKLTALDEALAEISRQTGYVLTATEPAGTERHDFGTDAVPFWSAVDSVAQRTNCAIVTVTADQKITLSRATARSPFVALDGAFRVELSKLHEDRDVDFTAPGADGAVGAREHKLTLKLSVLAEPRFIILMARPAQITEAIDDAGGKLTPPAKAEARPTSVIDFAETWRADFQFPAEGFLCRSPKAGTKIRTLSGVVPVRVVVERRRVLLPDIVKAEGKEFRVGNDTLTVRGVEHDANGGLDIRLQIPCDSNKNAKRDGMDTKRWLQRIAVEDIWGNQLQPNSYGSGASGDVHYVSIGCAAPSGWFNAFSPNLVVEDWVIMEPSVRFTFKDVPLP